MTNLIPDRAASRRAILSALGAGAASAALAGPTAFLSSAAVAAQGIGDADILTFALNLEYLEAEFYRVATRGTYLDALDIGGKGNAGATTGGKRVPFKNTDLARLAAEIAQDELEHVRFLRAALGAGAIAKPAIDLDALKIGFADDQEFIALARAFEDVGVSAYRGAARLIKNKDYLDAAAGILSTEAYHAGHLRSHAVYAGVEGPKVDTKDQPASKARWVPTDANGLAVGRTPAEVGEIVRGASAFGSAFFPKGLNGKIR